MGSDKGGKWLQRWVLENAVGKVGRRRAEVQTRRRESRDGEGAPADCVGGGEVEAMVADEWGI